MSVTGERASGSRQPSRDGRTNGIRGSLLFRRHDMRVEDRVRQFIKESFLVDEILDDESFLASGIIDSLGVMQLVSFIESELGGKVPDAHLVPENFDSIARMAAYVERMRRAA
jgi:acyl carrier protein